MSDEIRPNWTDNDVPMCSEACPQHDGKRCRATGFRPGPICEPVIVEMARVLRDHRVDPRALQS